MSGETPTHLGTRDRGAIGVAAALVVVVALAGASLVVDGGRALAARRYAAGVAEGAARAAVAPAGLATSVDAATARERARSHAIRSGVAPGDVVVALSPDAAGALTVVVTVTTRVRTAVLGLAGPDTLTVRATGAARASYTIGGGG